MEIAPSKAPIVTAGALHAIVVMSRLCSVFRPDRGCGIREKGESSYFIVGRRRGIVERLNASGTSGGEAVVVGVTGINNRRLN